MTLDKTKDNGMKANRSFHHSNIKRSTGIFNPGRLKSCLNALFTIAFAFVLVAASVKAASYEGDGYTINIPDGAYYYTAQGNNMSGDVLKNAQLDASDVIIGYYNTDGNLLYSLKIYSINGNDKNAAIDAVKNKEAGNYTFGQVANGNVSGKEAFVVSGENVKDSNFIGTFYTVALDTKIMVVATLHRNDNQSKGLVDNLLGTIQFTGAGAGIVTGPSSTGGNAAANTGAGSQQSMTAGGGAANNTGASAGTAGVNSGTDTTDGTAGTGTDTGTGTGEGTDEENQNDTSGLGTSVLSPVEKKSVGMFGDNSMLTILIIAGAAVLVLGIAGTITFIVLRKKKKARMEMELWEQEQAAAMQGGEMAQQSYTAYANDGQTAQVPNHMKSGLQSLNPAEKEKAAEAKAFDQAEMEQMAQMLKRDYSEQIHAADEPRQKNNNAEEGRVKTKEELKAEFERLFAESISEPGQMKAKNADSSRNEFEEMYKAREEKKESEAIQFGAPEPFEDTGEFDEPVMVGQVASASRLNLTGDDFYGEQKGRKEWSMDGDDSFRQNDDDMGFPPDTTRKYPEKDEFYFERVNDNISRGNRRGMRQEMPYGQNPYAGPYPNQPEYGQPMGRYGSMDRRMDMPDYYGQPNMPYYPPVYGYQSPMYSNMHGYPNMNRYPMPNRMPPYGYRPYQQGGGYGMHREEDFYEPGGYRSGYFDNDRPNMYGNNSRRQLPGRQPGNLQRPYSPNGERLMEDREQRDQRQRMSRGTSDRKNGKKEFAPWENDNFIY